MFDDTHVLDLLPAYALGSLEADEADRVEEHLLSCWICRAESNTFQDVVEQLSFAAPAEVPSPGLRDRLLQRVESVRPQSRLPAQATRRPWLERLLPAWGLASLGLILALAAFNVLLWQRLNQLEFITSSGGMRAIPLSAVNAASDATGFIIVSGDGGNGALVVDGLPPLDADRQYQLWLIRDGERTSGAVFSTDEESYGGTRISVAGSLLEYSAVGITIEPAGGSPQPTGLKVLGGPLFNP
ncbi:MAG: anti-sigma factor [Anaerolineales bacterium]